MTVSRNRSHSLLRGRHKVSPWFSGTPLSFEKKWAKYAIAAAAALAVPAVAQGDVVYSGPVDEAVSDGGSLVFSLNGVNPDFTLQTYAYGYNEGNGNYSYEGEVYLTSNAAGGVDTASPLSPGTPIGPSSPFSTFLTSDYEEVYGYSEEYTYGCGYKDEYTCYGYDYYGPYYYGQGANGDSLIGLEFTTGGQTYYGWADIYSDANTNPYAEGELLDYAYNNTPGGSIQAGQEVSPVPEPPSMVLFALGAAGIGLLLNRRRRALTNAQ